MWKSTLNPPILVVLSLSQTSLYQNTLSSELVYPHFPHEFNKNPIFLPSNRALLYFTYVSVYVG